MHHCGVAVEPKILLVNCFDERAMYAEYLEHVGWHPVQACEVDEAFATALVVQPDVVVTDMVLPNLGRDGLNLIRQLRANPRTERVCIIVVSGLVTPVDRRDAESAGADVFLMKPCLPQDLAHEIRSRLRTTRRPTALLP